MKLRKKLTVFAAMLTMMFAVFGLASFAYAAEDPEKPTFTAYAENDNVVVELKAADDMTGFGGFEIDSVVYDMDAFSYSRNDVSVAAGMELGANIAAGKFAAYSTNGVNLGAGDTIFKISFSKGPEYSIESHYSFELTVKEIYDIERNEYTSWHKNNDGSKPISFSVYYIEGEDYFTFVDTAGKPYKLYDSDIIKENIDPEKWLGYDVYMLKDVLPAKGVDEAKLANCCYKASDGKGYDISIDASSFDKMGVFYDDGYQCWRNADISLNKANWSVVTGLTTITAYNHAYTDGICTNKISNGRPGSEVASGHEVPGITFIDTAGNEKELSSSMIVGDTEGKPWTATLKNGTEVTYTIYMLSDVLNANGVDAANLADCCYIASDCADKNEYKMTFKADRFSNMALFYDPDKLGWRNTFDDETQVAWFAVTGLKAVTAVNHSYTDGVCHNQINVKKNDFEECGDKILLESIALNKTELTLAAGKTETLTVTFNPADAADKDLTWTSDKESVAAVDTAGKITAVAPGTAKITAAAGGKTAVCTVTVVENAADNASEAITALPAADKLTLNDKAAVEAARKAYNALTDEQKADVPAETLKKLEDAEKQIEKLEGDTKNADDVSAKLNALPAADKVTAADKAAVEAARAAYDALTDEQKAKVPAETLKKLEDAEKQIAALEKAAADAQANKVVKGKTYKVSSMKYKVTKADMTGKGTVTLTGTTKKKAKLTKLTVPATVKINGAKFKVTAIGNKAFNKFNKIKTLTIGKNVKTIGTSAFAGNTALTTATIKSTVLTSIGKSAFSGDKKLKTVKISSKKLKKVGKNAIKGIAEKAKIKVPKAKVSAYKKLFKSSTGFKKTMSISK